MFKFIIFIFILALSLLTCSKDKIILNPIDKIAGEYTGNIFTRYTTNCNQTYEEVSTDSSYAADYSVTILNQDQIVISPSFPGFEFETRNTFDYTEENLYNIFEVGYGSSYSLKMEFIPDSSKLVFRTHNYYGLDCFQSRVYEFNGTKE